MFQDLTRLAAPGTALAGMAPGLDWRLMLASGDDQTLLTIRDGAVTDADPGPHVMASWQTRLAAAEADWQAFLAPVPQPGHHDIFALLRREAMRFEGDLRPLMQNLMYVKRMLAALRPEAVR